MRGVRNASSLFLLLSTAVALADPPAELEPGDTVYMVWSYGRTPRVIECNVTLRQRHHAGQHELELEWPTPDDPYSASAWTAVDKSVVAFRERKHAVAVVASKLRKMAFDLSREADDLEGEKLIAERGR